MENHCYLAGINPLKKITLNNLQKEFMKNETLETPKQTWIAPVFTLLSINDVTLGLGGGGPDFGSELS